MDIQVEKPAATLARITFSVSAEEFQGEYRRGLQHERGRVRMKGFRPGKAPIAFVEKQIGAGLKDSLREHYLNEAWRKAQREHALKPFASPRVMKDGIEEGADGSFSLTFEVSLRPEVTLATYKGRSVTSELQHITDDDVARAEENLRKQQSRPQPAGEAGFQEEGIALGTVRFLFGEEEVFQREGLRLGIPQPPPGIEAEAWRAALAGQQEGAEVKVAMTLPESLPNEAARGQAGTCKVLLTKVYDLVPPTDEELCQAAQVEDIAAFRAKLTEHLENSARQGEEQRIESLLLDQVLKESSCELPEAVVADQTEARLQQFEHELSQRGVPEEERKKALVEQRKTATQEAERGLLAILVVEEIAGKESLSVTREDLDGELLAIAERNQASVEEVRKYYGENQGLAQQMAMELLERKVRAFLREQAEVKDPS